VPGAPCQRIKSEAKPYCHVKRRGRMTESGKCGSRLLPRWVSISSSTTASPWAMFVTSLGAWRKSSGGRSKIGARNGVMAKFWSSGLWAESGGRRRIVPFGFHVAFVICQARAPRQSSSAIKKGAQVTNAAKTKSTLRTVRQLNRRRKEPLAGERRGGGSFHSQAVSQRVVCAPFRSVVLAEPAERRAVRGIGLIGLAKELGHHQRLFVQHGERLQGHWRELRASRGSSGAAKWSRKMTTTPPQRRQARREGQVGPFHQVIRIFS